MSAKIACARARSLTTLKYLSISEISTRRLPITISKQIPGLKSSLQTGTIIFGPGAMLVAPIAFKPVQEATGGSGQFVHTGLHSIGMPNTLNPGIVYPRDVSDSSVSALIAPRAVDMLAPAKVGPHRPTLWTRMSATGTKRTSRAGRLMSVDRTKTEVTFRSRQGSF